MPSRFRKIKSMVIMGILLISIISITIPPVSAGLFFNLQSVITVGWSGNQTAEPVVPRGAIRPVDLEVSYVITRGVLGKGVLAAYSGKQAFVKLEVVDSSPWVTATLQSDTVAFELSETLQTKGNIVSFQVDEDAPAFGLGFIKIKASINKMTVIEGFEQTFTLNFVPSYKPLIDPSLPETNTKEIAPMDSAVFPIEVENLGNARTIVFFDVVSVPENWNAIVTSQVTLDEKVGATSTAYLVVKPDKGFGYHFEEKTIRVSLTPARADNLADRGETLYETFLVQSRGFSTPGFEMILLLGALLIFVIITKIKRKNKR
jgi:hypothetical protein